MPGETGAATVDVNVTWECRLSKRREKIAAKSKEREERRLSQRRRAEEILAEAASEFRGSRITFASFGSGVAAGEIARTHPNARVTCTFFDVFLADSARLQHEGISNLEFLCEPDLPNEAADSIAFALQARGENELARDLLQQAVQHLADGGRLLVATDNPKDHWLHEQLRGQFGKVTNIGSENGRLYIASKPKPLKKLKSFDCWFAIRDGARLIDLYSRPGVFSHRRLDLGARALIESLTVPDGPLAGEVIQDGMRVLDLGCGCGAVGIAAGLRADDVQIHAIDANARALQCTQIAAEKNGLACVSTQLEAEGRCNDAGTHDLVLANPPYYSNYRIGEIFLQATRTALRSGGRTHFVTKQPEWYADRFTELFDEVSVRELRGYFIVKGTQRKSR